MSGLSPKRKDELAEHILISLQHEGVAPIAEFARIAAGRASCLLCQGEGTVTEKVWQLHAAKAISFDMAKGFSEELGPCPDCYGRGFKYTSDERSDRALALLLNNMPVTEKDTGPIVQRFHRADTIEDAYELDKEMVAQLEDKSLEGEYSISLDDDEALIDAMEAEKTDIDNEVFWTRPVEGIELLPPEDPIDEQ